MDAPEMVHHRNMCCYIFRVVKQLGLLVLIAIIVTISVCSLFQFHEKNPSSVYHWAHEGRVRVFRGGT